MQKEFQHLTEEQRQTLLSLGQEHGTPLYVYNLNQVEANITNFTSAFSAVPMKIRYAMKALAAEYL